LCTQKYLYLHTFQNVFPGFCETIFYLIVYTLLASWKEFAYPVITQRVFQIAAGYEDCNDCNDLRDDMVLKTNAFEMLSMLRF